MPLLIILLVLVLYFLPTLVAAARHHHNAGSIFVIDLFLGWTFLGWIVALAMACSQVRPPDVPIATATGSWRSKVSGSEYARLTHADELPESFKSSLHELIEGAMVEWNLFANWFSKQSLLVRGGLFLAIVGLAVAVVVIGRPLSHQARTSKSPPASVRAPDSSSDYVPRPNGWIVLVPPLKPDLSPDVTAPDAQWVGITLVLGDFVSEEACEKTNALFHLETVVSKGRCVRDDNRSRVSSDIDQVMRWLTTGGPYGGWRLKEERSEMDGSPTVVLGLDSTDTVQGWLETAKPTLSVRCEEHKSSVFIVTGTAAQPVEGAAYNEYPVELRFDEGRPTTQWWSQSTDSKALFAPNVIALSRRLAKANKLRFRFTPFNASPAIASFDLHGLDRLLPKVANACDWAGADASSARAKGASAALRARLAQYLHPCADQTIGKRCWSDPDDILFDIDQGFEETREKALDDAVEYARMGVAFKKK